MTHKAPPDLHPFRSRKWWVRHDALLFLKEQVLQSCNSMAEEPSNAPSDSRQELLRCAR
jgi:hypothetical protein